MLCVLGVESVLNEYLICPFIIDKLLVCSSAYVVIMCVCSRRYCEDGSPVQVIAHSVRRPHADVHRFEKISNIVKQFKLSCR